MPNWHPPSRTALHLGLVPSASRHAVGYPPRSPIPPEPPPLPRPTPHHALPALLLTALAACEAEPPPPVPEPEVLVLDLSGAALTLAGDDNGPDLRVVDDDIEVNVPLRPGPYQLTIWGATSRFDGTPGWLRVTLDGADATHAELPEGPSVRVAVPLAVEAAGVHKLRLAFGNDAADGVLDRNIHLSRVTLSRTGGPTPDARAEALRAAIRGDNLVLISIDTLRADHLSAYGYDRPTSPVLAALADRGVRFDEAVATSHWTAPSHASMLTGLLPTQHGVHTMGDDAEALPDEATTLAERARAAGLQTAAFTAGIYVSEAGGFSQGFDLWEEGRDPADVRFARATRWLTEERDPDRPFLLFVHSFAVHEPFDPPPPYDRMFDPDYEEAPDRPWRLPLTETWFAGRRPTAAELAWVEALYDGGIRATDHALGGLLEALDALGLTEDTLVVVTSDHGEEFLDHGGMGHGQLFGECVRVPLIFAHPSLPVWADRTVDQITGGTDLVPTLADLLGWAPPEGIAGVSVVRALAGDPDPDAAALSMADPDRWSLLDARGHYLTDWEREHLFMLPEDRAEQRDVAGVAPDRTADYRRRVEAARAHPRVAAPPATRTDAEQQALEALGYTEEEAPSSMPK